MLSVPVLLAVLAIVVHGRLQVANYEQDKRCSRWVVGSSVRNLRSIHNSYGCAEEATIERRGFHVRACCATSVETRSDDEFPTGCGEQAIQPNEKRIVGGSIAVENSWPWQVFLKVMVPNTNMYSACGGALVSDRYVLTAAHCFLQFSSPSDCTVYAGKHHARETDPNEQKVSVEQIIIHEKYNRDTEEHDIALIRLSEPVKFSRAVNKICLPGPEAQGTDDIMWVVGWGREQHEGSTSPVLKQVALRLIPGGCNGYIGFDDQRDLCAGVAAGGSDTCQGDSGGPLMLKSNGKWYIEGVVSRGIGCGSPNSPSIYTRVSYYVDWIKQKIGEDGNSS